jgi:hypothetical protein
MLTLMIAIQIIDTRGSEEPVVEDIEAHSRHYQKAPKNSIGLSRTCSGFYRDERDSKSKRSDRRQRDVARVHGGCPLPSFKVENYGNQLKRIASNPLHANQNRVTRR